MVRKAGRGGIATGVRRTDDGDRRADDRPARATAGRVPRRAAAAAALAASALAAGLAAPAARAQQADSWTGTDKAKHFVVSAPFGALGASLGGADASTGTRLLYGTVLGALPGLAKEVSDIRNPRADASPRDMVFNVVGAALGALVADCCLIRPLSSRGDRVDGVGVEYRIEF